MGLRGVIALLVLVAGLAAANVYLHRRVAEQIRVGQGAVRRDIERLAAFHADLLAGQVALDAFRAGDDPGGVALSKRLAAVDEGAAVLRDLTPHSPEEAHLIAQLIASAASWSEGLRARIQDNATAARRAQRSVRLEAVSQSFAAILELHERFGRDADLEIARLQRRQQSLAFGISVLQVLTIAAAFAIHRRRAFLEAKVTAADQASAELRRMAASVAHEVNNQLGILQNTVALLKKSTAPEQLLPIQEQGIDQIRVLVRDLLEFSNPVLALEESVNLVELGHDVAQDFPDVSVSSEGPVFVRGDRRALTRALLNVVKNAVEAGGPVELRISAARSSALVVCRDRGPGIAAEHQPQIGQPFFTTKARGTGLGLAVVRQVVEGHGGRFELRNVDGGAVAELRLPHASVHPQGGSGGRA